MNEVPKLSHREVPGAVEADVAGEGDSELFRGGDDLLVRHERAAAPHGALRQRVQLQREPLARHLVHLWRVQD